MLGIAILATLVVSMFGFYLERQDNLEIRHNATELASVTKVTCEIQRRDLRAQRYVVGAAKGFNEFLLLPPLFARNTPRRQVQHQKHIIVAITTSLKGYVTVIKQQPLTRIC